MDIFAWREAPVHGHLRLRVPFEGSGLVSFTLDERENGGSVVWYACWANLRAQNIGSIDDRVRERVRRGLDIVGMQVPSAEDVHLDVSLDRAGGRAEIVCVGEVSFLASEWEIAKSAHSLGELLSARA